MRQVIVLDAPENVPARLRSTGRDRATISPAAATARYASFMVISTIASFAIAGDQGPSGAVGRGPSQRVQLPPEGLRCGPNAIYMLLRAYDLPVSADEVLGQANLAEQGLSLIEVRNALRHRGLESDIRRCTYEQLVNQCRLPLIALVYPMPELVDHSSGHYVLVLAGDSDGVNLIDGTSGEKLYLARNSFGRIWLGHVVVPVSGEVDWVSLLAFSVTAWTAVVSLILLTRRSAGLSRKDCKPG
jgi:hypothetical protein